MGVTKQIIKNINSINKKGLSSVFSANVINKIIAFLSNVVVVRVLTQKEFGYYSSANNIISFALLITGAGLLSGVLQYGAEQRPEEIKNQYYKQYVTKENLDELEHQFIVTIHKLLEKQSLLEQAHVREFLSLWNDLSEKEVKQYLTDQLNSEYHCLKFICVMSKQWRGTNGPGWSYDHKFAQKFISEEALVKHLDDYDKKEIINDFTESELIKLASFKLNQGRKEDNHSSENEAKSLVEKWRNAANSK